jgi:hypothetical protein
MPILAIQKANPMIAKHVITEITKPVMSAVVGF